MNEDKCPDCGNDPADPTLHAEGCRRTGQSVELQCGPPWTPWYCGLKVDGSGFASTPADKRGYCGPGCGPCGPSPVLMEQDGVWCCAADFDPERDG